MKINEFMFYLLSDFFIFVVVDLILLLVEKFPDITPMWRNTQFESQPNEVLRWLEQKVPETLEKSAVRSCKTRWKR